MSRTSYIPRPMMDLNQEDIFTLISRQLSGRFTNLKFQIADGSHRDAPQIQFRADGQGWTNLEQAEETLLKIIDAHLSEVQASAGGSFISLSIAEGSLQAKVFLKKTTSKSAIKATLHMVKTGNRPEPKPAPAPWLIAGRLVTFTAKPGKAREFGKLTKVTPTRAHVHFQTNYISYDRVVEFAKLAPLQGLIEAGLKA